VTWASAKSGRKRIASFTQASVSAGPALPADCLASVVQGFGVLRPQTQSVREAGESVVETVLQEQGMPEVIVRLSAFGLQAQDVAVAGDGFVEAAQGLQRDTQVVVELRICRIDVHGPADQRDGLVAASSLMDENTEQVQRRGCWRGARSTSDRQAVSASPKRPDWKCCRAWANPIMQSLSVDPHSSSSRTLGSPRIGARAGSSAMRLCSG